MATKILLGRAILFLSYLMFGAWLFSYVERTPVTYSEMSEKMLNELHIKYNIDMNHSEFLAFVNEAYKAFKVGRKVDWTFLNATTFVFSALTTLGYGHMTPETTLGQLLTVLYCLIGLPITMLALKTIGEAIVSGVHSCIFRIEKRLFNKRHRHRIKTKSLIVVCLLMMIFLLLGAVIETLVEDWTFVEGIYAWFVTFSTIGFGDYVPLQALEQYHAKRKDSAHVWVLIFGMSIFVLAGFCVVSAVLTSLVASAEELKKKTIYGVWKRNKNKIFRAAAYNTEYGNKCKSQGDEFVLNKTYRQRSESI